MIVFDWSEAIGVTRQGSTDVDCKHESFTGGVACGKTITGLQDDAPCKQESFTNNVACGGTGSDVACNVVNRKIWLRRNVYILGV